MDDEIEDHPAPTRLNGTPSHSAPRNNHVSTSGPRVGANPDRTTGQAASTRTGVVQPKPQTLPKRTGPTSIIVSPRQKGNPVLNHVKGIPWEYGDIPADYVLGMTTCALFLSLKYHKLHPEYIYNRIKALAGKYALRVVLVMVDVQNHEDSLKELSKTSLINNVTLVLCWSAAEGGRYLELFKSYEHAAPTSIKHHQSTAYADRMVDFITSPRSINKTDAVSLVSQFGTVRTAVNASHDDLAGIAGWGDKKVRQWCSAVREPFRIQRAAKRGGASREVTLDDDQASRESTLSRDQTRAGSGSPALRESLAAPSDADRRPQSRLAEELRLDEEAFLDDDSALAEAMIAPPIPAKHAVETSEQSSRKRKPEDEALSEGVLAALNKYRKQDG